MTVAQPPLRVAVAIPTKGRPAVVGEAVPVEATVFREGHDAVAAYAVLTAPDGREAARVRMHELSPGSDRFGAWVVPDATGDWATFEAPKRETPASTANS